MKKLLAVICLVAIALSGISALAEYGAVVKKSAWIYTDSELRNSIKTLPKYTAVKVLSVKSGRAKVSYNGVTVWMYSKYLGSPLKTVFKQLAKHGIETRGDMGRYVRKSCYMYDYPGSGANRLKKVKKGTILIGVGEKNGWSMVTDDDEAFYGYIKTSNLYGYGFGDGTKFSLKNWDIINGYSK